MSDPGDPGTQTRADAATRDGDPAEAAEVGSLTPPSGWDTATLSGLRAVVAEDREVNGRSWLIPATQMLALHRFGEWLDDEHRSPAVRRLGTVLFRTGYAYVRNVLGFEVPRTTRIGRRVKFSHQHGVAIHPHAQVGDGCRIHHGVTIGLRGDPDVRGVYDPPPLLGAEVQLGVGCAVVGPVRIGDAATIGPNAVVMKDVPAGASVVAMPSRILRLR